MLSIAFSAVCGQNGFNDGFDDGNFTNSPIWIGETSKFVVNTNNQLQLNNNPPNSPAYLATASSAIDSTTWEFYVKLDFAPSASNYAEVYLSSDSSNLNGSVKGYFLKIGGISGSADDISLYRSDSTSASVKIIDGTDSIAGTTSVELNIKVFRDIDGSWSLFIDRDLNGNYLLEGPIVIDTTYKTSSYFGVKCIHTSTRNDKFFFDDFNVFNSPPIDTIPPQINSLELLDENSIILSFNEKLDPLTALLDSNYSLNFGQEIADTLTFETADQNKIKLDFRNNFTNGFENQLIVKNVRDTSANSMQEDTLKFVYLAFETAMQGDIIINEFYPDVSPSNGLPEAEFVELYNRSDKFFNLKNWKLSDASSTAELDSFILRPKEYVILCSQADENDFEVYGNTLGVNSFPVLNNSEDKIELANPFNNIISKVDFNLDWYKDNTKRDGGWTIEAINPNSNCPGSINYAASVALIGGTPGQINSVYDTIGDTTSFILESISVISSDSISLLFNKPIDSSSINTAIISIDNLVGVSSINFQGSTPNTLLVLLSTPLDSGEISRLSINLLYDCYQNLIIPNEIRFALAQKEDAGDIVINEILFNPRPSGFDFVEFYNRSDKVLDLKNWLIANEDTTNLKDIVSESFIMLPNQYVVITEDIENIVSEYPNSVSKVFIQIEDLPSYNDDNGVVYLFNKNKKIIDEVGYSEDMHFSLLVDNEGVSLERLDPARPSDDRSNFQSAAASVGFATPGFENSQKFKSSKFDGTISIEPKTISPDNDGYQDVLNINYSFSSSSNVVNIDIYDEQGRLVKDLVNNVSIGNAGIFSWDGLDDNNQKARVGIYILFFEVFDLEGNKEVFKSPFVVAARLD